LYVAADSILDMDTAEISIDFENNILNNKSNLDILIDNESELMNELAQLTN